MVHGFSANIGFLWTDLPLVERIARAAAAGFDAVEMHFPYDTPVAETRAALDAAGLPLISLNTRPGLARKVGQLAAEAGLAITPPGATFPYGNDPEDSNLRIAPTFAALDDLKTAMEVFALCVKLASVREEISKR